MKNANGVTHTATMRGQYHADELAVLFFTKMTKEELTDFKLDTGKEWLVKYAMREGLSQQEAEELWMDPLLLQWWNLEWRRMDHAVILPILHKIVEQERLTVYQDMHLQVFLKTHPDYTMLEMALARVMKRLTEKTSEV